MSSLAEGEASYLQSFSPDNSAGFTPNEVFSKAVHIALRPACDRSSVFSVSQGTEIEPFLPCSLSAGGVGRALAANPPPPAAGQWHPGCRVASV